MRGRPGEAPTPRPLRGANIGFADPLRGANIGFADPLRGANIGFADPLRGANIGFADIIPIAMERGDERAQQAAPLQRGGGGYRRRWHA